MRCQASLANGLLKTLLEMGGNFPQGTLREQAILDFAARIREPSMPEKEYWWLQIADSPLRDEIVSYLGISRIHR